MLTDNPVLIRKHVPLPALMCEQKKGVKKVPTEEDMIQANINSFGNDIGKITNRITSMFEIASGYDDGSPEKETLEYRIRCGQLLQQCSIDRAKGVVSKPMPRYWYDRHNANQIGDDELREFNRRIAADRKPYFMCYIYPDMMRQYKRYMRNTNKNALREFGEPVSELLSKPYQDLTERQIEFLGYFKSRLPVGFNDCTMNIICRKFENRFDGYRGKFSASHHFDYTIMKSGGTYTSQQRVAVKHLYDEYLNKQKRYAVFSKYERVDTDEVTTAVNGLKEDFRRRCMEICQDDAILCDILLDLCYKKSSTKSFVWEMFPDAIVYNLLSNNGNMMCVPTLSENGHRVYCGEKYITVDTVIGVKD